jgi:peptide/nickel transport system permease protein
MLAYIIRRFLLAVITVWAITVLTFVIIQLPPGDFVSIYINSLQSSGSQVSFGQA